MITLIVLAQIFSGIMEFYKGLRKNDLSDLVNTLQSTDGNKNIFAAALVIKIPIIIYGVVNRKGFVKHLSLLSLFLAILVVFLINARSAYLGLIISVVALIIGLSYLQFKKIGIKQFKISSLLVAFGVYIIAFIVSQNAIKQALKFNNNTVYGTLTNR